MDVATLDGFLERLRGGGALTVQEIVRVCTALREELLEEPNMRLVASPVTVVGDIRGQFHDLQELFLVFGDVPQTNYIFLGNYTERDGMGLETITFLLCLQLRFPARVTLLRGTLESAHLSRVFGLWDECQRKYRSDVAWRALCSVFPSLCVCALVDRRVLCVHGGLSPHLQRLDEVSVLHRFHEFPEGCLTDLIWSEPWEDWDGMFLPAKKRSVGHFFGEEAVHKFTSANKIDLIVVGETLQLGGYKQLFREKIASLWSAPAYLGRMGNVGGVLQLEEVNGTLKSTLRKFYASPLSKRTAHRKNPNASTLLAMQERL